MGKILTSDELQGVLVDRLAAFLDDQKQKTLGRVFARWQQDGLEALLFGGVLRDLLILGPDIEPRDIDLVVTNRSAAELAEYLSSWIARRNRFGGFHLRVLGHHLDVWALGDTWGLQYILPSQEPAEALVQTTFLNVEGIAANLPSNYGPFRMYEHGFISALQTQTLDINLEPNPFPALAAVRACITSKRLNYKLSRRLATYVLRVTADMGVDALVAAQQSHYGQAMLDVHSLRKMITDIQDLNYHPTDYSF